MSARQIFVRVAQHGVGSDGDILITLGLGSCVAVLLYDTEARVGGMAHVLLPASSMARDPSHAAKFADTAVPFLVEELRPMGGRLDRFRARLIGGASMFSNLLSRGSLNMGERNIDACRKALSDLSIPVTAEDVGADYGRSVRFWPGDGRTLITSVGRGDVTL